MRPPAHHEQSTSGRVGGAMGDLRAQPVMAVPALLRELGVDPLPILRRAGIEPEALEQTENRVPFAAVGRLLVESAAATGCPHIGLLLGERAGPASVGIVGELARHARDVRAGLRALIVHFHLHDRGAVPMLAPHGERTVELAYMMVDPGAVGTAHIADAAMVIALGLMRAMCGPRWRPVEVTLAHRQPADVAPYRRAFGAPVRFDAPRSAIVFEARWLDEPIAGRDPDAQAALQRRVSSLEASTPVSYAHRVREALGHMVVAGKPTADRVAEALGTTRRTLHRRLVAEDTTFQALLEEVRCELARQLLIDTRMSLGDIAASLGYSEPGAFSRAFRGWTGMTPSECRAGARG